MWVHCCSPSTESAVGYESGMMSSGYIQQRDGLKGGRGVILTNHNKGRATSPSRLGEWRKGEKRATVWKIKSLSLHLSTQRVSLISTVCLLFIYEPHKNMDLWRRVRCGPNPRPWTPVITHILHSNKTTSGNICDFVKSEYNYKAVTNQKTNTNNKKERIWT